MGSSISGETNAKFTKTRKTSSVRRHETFFGMNSMLPLLLLGDGLGGSGTSGTNDLLLPLMLMGGMGGDPNNPNGGMNSLLPLLLLGDDAYVAKDDAALTIVCNGIADIAKKTQCDTAKGTYLAKVVTCSAITDATLETTCMSESNSELNSITNFPQARAVSC